MLASMPTLFPLGSRSPESNALWVMEKKLFMGNELPGAMNCQELLPPSGSQGQTHVNGKCDV